MTGLDDLGALQALDPGGMLLQVAGLPAQFGRAAAARAAFEAGLTGGAAAGWPPPGGAARSVCVCGMGGSAIGGDFAAAWGAPAGLRLEVHRGYGLPAWVDAETLLLFSSYSGNTEETLSAFAAAAATGAARACITSGGALAARAHAAGVPVFAVPGGLQPRAALGHSLVALLVLLQAAGCRCDEPLPALAAAARHLESLAERFGPGVPEARNPAKRLARAWHDRLPCFYTGSGSTRPVGQRWKTQVHENAKTLAIANVFPELDHNEIMAWQALPEVRRRVVLVLLRDRDDPEPVQRRMQVTAEILAGRVAAVEWLDTSGGSALERNLGAVFLGDYASVYLAFLYGVDPTPVVEIETLKQRLAARA